MKFWDGFKIGVGIACGMAACKIAWGLLFALLRFVF